MPSILRRAAALAALSLLATWTAGPAGAQTQPQPQITAQPLAAAVNAPVVAVPGGVTYQQLGTYDLAKLDAILSSELKDFLSASTMPTELLGGFPAARYPVRLYRVSYPSVVPELGNRPTVASGLVAVPDGAGAALPVVSYQHGTVFDRTYVPSNPDASMETRILIARFAGQGYAVIGADYFGRGQSDLPDSYLVKASTQQATYDMLTAAKAVLSALGVTPGKLFLSGWSQGGWATMAFLEKLEQAGEPVAAAAAASAPVDVLLAVNRWLNNPQPVDAAYLPAAVAIQLQAMGYYRQMPGLDATAIKPAYLAAARDFYAGRIDFETFYERTTGKLEDFTTQDFRTDVALARGAYAQALDASAAYRWRRVTPVKVWYGGADEVTPVFIGTLPQEVSALLGGAPTQALDAGPKADHRAVFVTAVRDQKAWFDGLVKQAPARPQ